LARAHQIYCANCQAKSDRYQVDEKDLYCSSATLIASLAGLAFGTSDVANVWQIIFNPFTDTTSISHQIVWELRGTRIAAAILVGASLGIAGTLAQGSTNNPLAEPTILGTSAGAALGVLLGVLSNLVEIGSVGAVLFAACGALLVTTLVFSLAHSALSLITVGIGVSAIVSALVGLTLTAVNRPDARSISFWTLGSFALVTPSDLLILGANTFGGRLCCLEACSALRPLIARGCCSSPYRAAPTQN
jgi:iron complex transport system permease protein